MSDEPRRRPNGDPYPKDILFLADFFGLDPEHVMRHGTSYLPRTIGSAASDGSLDPDRVLE